MLEVLTHLFAAVCGQNPEHTWSPGGLLLPCCQRCAGFYAGACVAALVHWWLRPKPTGRFLEVHGAFLLVMLPLGFHWLPHGPVLRTLSGVLFGFGVVAFLWLPLGAALERPRTVVLARIYAVSLAGTLVLVPFLAFLGGELAAYSLSGLAFCGALALGALVAADLALGVAGAIGFAWRRPWTRTQA